MLGKLAKTGLLSRRPRFCFSRAGTEKQSFQEVLSNADNVRGTTY